MVLKTLHTTKKTFYYNFFPTKSEEEYADARKLELGLPIGRVLVEIRDIYPPPVIDLDNPWQIKKTLNQYEVASGKFVLSFNDTFEHVLRYWTYSMANWIVLGRKIGVTLWDATQENARVKYQGNDVYLNMIASDDCVLSCFELMRDRNLKVNDEVMLYWDLKDSSFQFKLV